MISEELADALLQPIALPTLEAFDAANAVTKSIRDASDAARKTALGPMLATHDGNAFWAFFASELHQRYEAVPGVHRVPMTHPLVSEWTLPGGVVLRLKSDVTAVDGSQLSLDIDVPSVGGEIVVLTYDHEGPERIYPAFMQPLGKRHQAWVWTPARLMAATVAVPEVVRTQRPATKVSSALPPSEHIVTPPEQSASDSPEQA